MIQNVRKCLQLQTAFLADITMMIKYYAGFNPEKQQHFQIHFLFDVFVRSSWYAAKKSNDLRV